MIIRIKSLRANGILGVYEKERIGVRPVVVNLAVEIDGTAAASTDDISATVDYSTIRDRVVRVIETSDARLLEHLAALIVDTVLEDPRVIAVEAEVDKPAALRMAESVAVIAFARRGPGQFQPMSLCGAVGAQVIH